METINVKNDYRWRMLRFYNRHAILYDLWEFIRRGTRRKAMKLSG